jgi:hypothetical protein
VYSVAGGIIDLAHVRDVADQTRYIACRCFHAMARTVHTVINLRNDYRSACSLQLNGFGRTSSANAAALAGARASYEVAIWHEIATYFDDNPALPQKVFTAFSPEDNFSNLLGALLGAAALLGPEDSYDLAIDHNLGIALDKLGAVDVNSTEEALTFVDGIWFKSGGLTGELIRRHLDCFDKVTPWRVTDLDLTGLTPSRKLTSLLGPFPSVESLEVPITAENGDLLSSFYALTFIPDSSLLAKMAGFLPSGKTTITPSDFPGIVAKIRADLQTVDPKADQPDP